MVDLIKFNSKLDCKSGPIGFSKIGSIPVNYGAQSTNLISQIIMKRTHLKELPYTSSESYVEGL